MSYLSNFPFVLVTDETNFNWKARRPQNLYIVRDTPDLWEVRTSWDIVNTPLWFIIYISNSVIRLCNKMFPLPIVLSSKIYNCTNILWLFFTFSSKVYYEFVQKLLTRKYKKIIIELSTNFLNLTSYYLVHHI